MDFSTAIQEFGFDCKIRKLSAKTIDNYRKQLLYLQRYLSDEHKITDVAAVRASHIKLFLDMMDAYLVLEGDWIVEASNSVDAVMDMMPGDIVVITGPIWRVDTSSDFMPFNKIYVYNDTTVESYNQ